MEVLQEGEIMALKGAFSELWSHLWVHIKNQGDLMNSSWENSNFGNTQNLVSTWSFIPWRKICIHRNIGHNSFKFFIIVYSLYKITGFIVTFSYVLWHVQPTITSFLFPSNLPSTLMSIFDLFVCLIWIYMHYPPEFLLF